MVFHVFFLTALVTSSFLLTSPTILLKNVISSLSDRATSSPKGKVKSIKMSADMKFDYKKALKKLNVKESDVIELRETIKKFENVPKSLSSRKVRS